VDGITIDFGGLAQILVDGFMGAIKALLQPVPLDFANWLRDTQASVLTWFDSINFLTHVPLEWTVNNEDVARLWWVSALWQVGIAGIVLAIQGWRVASGRADLYEVVIRTAFLMILGFGLLVLFRPIFSMVNAMADAFYGTPFSAEGHNELVMVALQVVALFFEVLAWIKGMVGTVFICILLVLGPTMLSVSALPWFGGLGQWWAKEMTTWCLRPIFVALAIRLGLGIGSHMPGAIEILFAIVAYWLAWTADTRIRSFSVGAWGSLAQMNLFARGAGMVAGAMSPAAAPAAAAATAAAAA